MQEKKKRKRTSYEKIATSQQYSDFRRIRVQSLKRAHEALLTEFPDIVAKVEISIKEERGKPHRPITTKSLSVVIKVFGTEITVPEDKAEGFEILRYIINK